MHCLVVDPNVAFATLLKEELARLGHTVDVCSSGANALALVESSPPDLALLDMGLESPDALTLGHRLRALRHDTRLMLIPMMGEVPDVNDGAPTIQGVLPKPFFLPELPDRIASAFAVPLDNGAGSDAASRPEKDPAPLDSRDTLVERGPVERREQQTILVGGARGESSESGSEEPASLDWLDELPSLDVGDTIPLAAAQPQAQRPHHARPANGREVKPQETPESADAPTGISRRAFRMNQGRIEAVMRELVAEVGADGVLLTCDAGVLTAAGGLGEEEIASISAAVVSGSRASAEMARALGREQLRFEQSIAGGSYLLYALGIHDAILAVTVSGDAPLGLLRLRARAAAERIAVLCV